MSGSRTERSTAGQTATARLAALRPLFGVRLTISKQCPSQARRFALSVLDIWGADARAHDWAALVVSELVTNVCVHTDSAHTWVFAVRRSASASLVVFDRGSALASLPTPGGPGRLDAESGRGLQLVAAFSASWGSRISRRGSVAWASHPMRYVARKPPVDQCGTSQGGAPVPQVW